MSTPQPDPAAIGGNLTAVRQRIARAGGDPGSIAVVAVTKGFGAGEVAAAAAAGFTDFGENYAQELLEKQPAAPQANWHFLGPVQRNKVSRIASMVSLWHAVDRLEEGQAIGRATPGAGVLVQVNATGAPGQAGVPTTSTPALVDRLRALDLDVRGLMVVGAHGDPAATEMAFGATAELAGRLGLRELSMGMTEDLELAVAAGATIVRVGRALFGPRPELRQARR